MKTNEILPMLIYSLLSVFGAMARQLSLKDKVPTKLLAFFSGCFIASFMGVILYFITRALSMDPNLAYAISGLGGWIGPQLLDSLAEMIMKKSGMK